MMNHSSGFPGNEGMNIAATRGQLISFVRKTREVCRVVVIAAHSMQVLDLREIAIPRSLQKKLTAHTKIAHGPIGSPAEQEWIDKNALAKLVRGPFLLDA